MARETPCSTPLQCLIFLLMATPLLAAAVVLMVLFLPYSPNFQIVALQTSPIVLTPFVFDCTLMSATWNLTFVARNPNKRLELHYKDVDVAVYYQWLSLSSQKLGFFKQSEDSEVVAQASVTASAVLSNQNAAAMEKEGREDLAVNFIVKFRGTVRVYVGTSLGVDHALSIDCDGIKVVFSPQNGTGRMLGATRRCHSNKLIF
ncbi:uncharacterized protein LOC114735861 [Neltuma alba]|uniref:uncharacterized protein LOC114735861 n=1 Tax=Neltuma alba TaxID=207710 RepID=UPI0010A55D4B|nr:uncharacterized protein LOC114735861 [Prosopis alba]